jgi:transposase InsO family protein
MILQQPAGTTNASETGFESQLFHSLARLCGIQLSRTTAYHPAANGLVERFHRMLKAAIMCHADQQWTEALPLVLLGIRTSFKADLQVSVAELIYGEPEDSRRATDPYSGPSGSHHTAAPSHGPPQTSSGITPRLFRHVRAQGPP